MSSTDPSKNNKALEAYQTLTLVNSWITNIDGKISKSIAMSGAFAGLISISDKLDSFQRTIFLFLDVVAIVLFFLGLRATTTHKKADDGSLVFYAEIAKVNRATYIDKFMKMSQEEYIHDLLDQAQINAMLCRKKTWYYNWGVIFMILSVITWLVINVWGFVPS